MLKVVEVEKIGKKLRQTVLYSGASAQIAERIAHFETQAYHRRKVERKGDDTTIVLEVDS